ncbi:ferritin-like domain-containing protein [Peptostreptococcus faecalis]|uniref:ferritin-like domain-containing protein n=1 Tax=Peptostreptococcus faecalis TaxID=2045015 RepID=UPI000C7B60C5|nr:ferritin family protein [Peptostreptococcus faecalis]
MNNSNYVEILKYAMNMEQKASEFYKMYLDKVQENSNKEIFKELADMEDDHYNILNEQCQKLENNGSFDQVDVSKLKGGEDIFKINERDIKSMDFNKAVDDLPILRMAYAMESDFAKFYDEAAKKAEDPNAKKLLETLASWEIAHRDSFDAEIKLATENSWFSNSFSPF